MADQQTRSDGRLVRAALEFRPEEYEGIKRAAYCSGLLRSKFYSIAVAHLSSLPPEERQRIVAEYLQAEGKGE